MSRKLHPARPHFTVSLGVASLVGGLAAPGTARADVTVVSQVAVTEVVQPALDQAVPLGTPPPQRQESSHSPLTVTTYYQGGSARVESSDGTVVVYDGAAGKVYTLDPAQKTYSVRSYKDALEPPPPATGGPGGQTKADASIDVTPEDQTKIFVGAAAKVYTVSGVITLSPQRRESGGRGAGGGRRHGRGGGFPGGGGGGFPGGGGGGFPLLRGGRHTGGGGYDPNGGGSASNGGGRTRSVEVSGEFWLSDAVKLPDDKKASVLPALQVALSEGSPALKPLADSLNKKKDIPLDSRLTLTHTVPRTGAQDSVTTTMQVTSVSSAPLTTALFRLPLGYTQIAPPAPIPSDGDSNGGDTNGGFSGRTHLSPSY